jgi:hypothetical protein
MFPFLDDICKTCGLTCCNEVVGRVTDFLEKLCQQLQNMSKERIFSTS